MLLLSVNGKQASTGAPPVDGVPAQFYAIVAHCLGMLPVGSGPLGAIPLYLCFICVLYLIAKAWIPPGESSGVGSKVLVCQPQRTQRGQRRKAGEAVELIPSSCSAWSSFVHLRVLWFLRNGAHTPPTSRIECRIGQCLSFTSSVNATLWGPLITQFDPWFGHVVGSADRLTQRAVKTGRRWYAGRARCADALGRGGS